jgi:hypothetical protein
MYLRIDIIENTTGKSVISAEFYDEYGKRLTAGFKNEWTGYTFVNANRKLVKMRLYLDATAKDDSYIKFKNPIIVREGLGTNADYAPFIQETYQLPETLELGEWDSFNPQTGEITRATSKQLILTGDENWGARGTGTEAGDTLYRNYIRLSSIAPTNARAVQAVSNLYNGVTAEDAYFCVTGVSASDKYIDIYDPDFATNDVSLWTQHLRDLYVAGTPLIVEYKLAAPTVEKLENAHKSYTAYNQGNETIVNENDVYGAMPTVMNEYMIIL